MKELKLKEPISVNLEQYECLGCNKKFYVNKEDVDELLEDIDCPFCNVHGVPNIRLFKVIVNEIFEKEDTD